jgi:hypothetical protein
VKAMLDGDISAQQKVDQAVLAKKAAAWRYEKEWRLIGTRGQSGCPLELEEVIFGMRCAETVKYAVVTALATRKRSIKFYEIRESRGSFLLKRYALDINELLHYYPQRFLDVYDAFGDYIANSTKIQK